MYSCKVLLDSVSESGNRIVTVEACYPRFAHSELLTHRMLSRNSASSRAIPIHRVIEAVKTDPVIPVWWGKNQSGMQANDQLVDNDLADAKNTWLAARDIAVKACEQLSNIGLHKQLCNRLLEPWMWITTIITATEWDNFFTLRCHKDAQPELRMIAEMIREELDKSIPQRVDDDCWHLPLVDGGYDGDQMFHDRMTEENMIKISAGRCARVSYLTHEGKRDPQSDIDLCDKLVNSSHWSPLEHPAEAMPDSSFYGNLRGWKSYRKQFDGESGVNR